MAISRQWIGKHIPSAMNMHVTMELLLETVFSTWYMQKGYRKTTRATQLRAEAEKRWHYSSVICWMVMMRVQKLKNVH
jgi:hypothetical protein